MPNSKSSSRSWRVLRFCLLTLAGLVTLVALFYAEEDWRGKRAWKAYVRQLEARGITLDWHSLVPPPVPDDQNFAMTPFLAPLYDFNPKPLKPGQNVWRDTNGYNRVANFGQKLKFDSSSKSWAEGQMTDLGSILKQAQQKTNSPAPAASLSTRAETAAEVLREFEQYGSVLEELRIASQRPYSRFNISYGDEDPAGILLPHEAFLKRFSLMLCVRGSAELALGKTDAAFDDLNLIFSLADSIQSEPLTISLMVRIAMLKVAQQLVWEGLAEHCWSDSQLQEIEARLQKLSLLKDAGRCGRVERGAFGVGEFEFLRKHPYAFVSFSGSGKTMPESFFRILPSGWLYMEQVSYQRIFDEKILPGFDPEAARVHPHLMDDNAKDLDGLLQPSAENFLNHRVMARFLLLPVNIFQKAARGQTDVDETILACALEHYRMAKGAFPETLAALVPQFIKVIPNDVITGEPLIYHRTADGQFVLYSVGWNEKDDGGTVVMTADGKAIDVTQGDWAWPQYPGK